MLVGPLYTHSRAENDSIKWTYRVAPLQKTHIDVGSTTLYPLPSRECLHKVDLAGCTLKLYFLPSRESLYKVAWPGCTPEKTQSNVGWTTLYPLPSRECLHKVAVPGCTPEIDAGWTTLYPFPSREWSIKWPYRVTPWNFTSSRAENASIKWPDRVAPLKKPNRCWLDHFIPIPDQRMPL